MSDEDYPSTESEEIYDEDSDIIIHAAEDYDESSSEEGPETFEWVMEEDSDEEPDTYDTPLHVGGMVSGKKLIGGAVHTPSFVRSNLQSTKRSTTLRKRIAIDAKKIIPKSQIRNRIAERIANNVTVVSLLPFGSEQMPDISLEHRAEYLFEILLHLGIADLENSVASAVFAVSLAQASDGYANYRSTVHGIDYRTYVSRLEQYVES